MSDFFGPPPPPPPPAPRHEPPPWSGAPRGVLPGVIALELLLGRSDRGAVAITRLAGYPAGFQFDLVAMTAPGFEEDLDPMLFGPYGHHRRRGGSGGWPDDMLRLGVQFADGGRATNVGGHHHGFGEPPIGPVMHGGGGGGGGGDWHQSMWVWPLPPPGRLSFVCEWPAVGIEQSRTEIDAQLVLDAAARAQPIFPGPPGGASSSAVVRTISVSDDDPPPPRR